jgi:hypothetical protein
MIQGPDVDCDGAVVEKIILIQTNESDAWIDATKTGFEKEFATDLKYALKLISQKDVT